PWRTVQTGWSRLASTFPRYVSQRHARRPGHDGQVNRVHAGNLTGQRVDGVFRLLERQRIRVHLRKRIAAGLDDVDRAEGIVDRHAQHAADRQLLVDHVVHRALARRAHALEAGDHDTALAVGDG